MLEERERLCRQAKHLVGALFAGQILDEQRQPGADAPMLDRLAAVLNRDLDNTIQRAETIAKPVIILALGAVVALVAAAVYQPLIEMYNRI